MADEPSAPFLAPNLAAATNEDGSLTRSSAFCLFVSHFLSMWNSRTYEYGAILFIQASFPGNLLPSSINGIAETICVLFFASALGRWVDAASSRLRPLLLTILANRITLVASCLVWLVLFALQDEGWRRFLFAVVLILGMVEKVSRMTNILSMERDWVPILANVAIKGSNEGTRVQYDLTHLNTIMRRIDIACKLLAPLAISAFVAAVSPSAAAATIGAISVVTTVVEIWSAMRVWNRNPRLRVAKEESRGKERPVELDSFDGLKTQDAVPLAQHSRSPFAIIARLVGAVRSSWRSHVGGLHYYFSSSVWLPSIFAAVLHGSVLAWSGTLIMWLLNAGFPLSQVTVAKGIGSIFEIGSTVAFPLGVNFLSKHYAAKHTTDSYEAVDGQSIEEESTDDSDADELGSTRDTRTEKQLLGGLALSAGVVKVAQWAICFLFLNLVPTITALFFLDAAVPANPPYDGAPVMSPLRTSTSAAVVFFAFLSFSFLGRWTYDLSVTQLTQTFIPATHRSTFGGTEQAIVSCVSMVHWVGAAIWHEEDDFKWLALGSFCAVGAAAAAYVFWARRWERTFQSVGSRNI